MALRGLGTAGSVLVGAGEYANARSQGDSRWRSLARGGVEVATGTAAWVAQPVSQASASFTGSLYNPANAIDLFRGQQGQARIQQRMQDSQDKQAQVKDFYGNLSGNVVNAVAPGSGGGSTTEARLATSGLAIGGAALSTAAFIASGGRKGKVANPAKAAKGVKAANAFVQQGVKAAQGTKAAQQGAKAAQAAAARTPGPVKNFLGKTSTKVVGGLGASAMVGSIALDWAKQGVYTVAPAVNPKTAGLGGARPAPAAAAGPAPGAGFMPGTVDYAMYNNQQEPWWTPLAPGPIKNMIRDDIAANRGLAWQKLDYQREAGEKQYKVGMDGNQAQRDVAAMGGATARAVAGTNAEALRYVADQQYAGIRDTNNTQLRISDYESGRRLEGIKDTNLSNVTIADLNNQGSLNVANAQGNWNLQQTMAQGATARDVAGIDAQGRIGVANTQGSWGYQQEMARGATARDVATIDSYGRQNVATIQGRTAQNVASIDARGRMGVASIQGQSAQNVASIDARGRIGVADITGRYGVQQEAVRGQFGTQQEMVRGATARDVARIDTQGRLGVADIESGRRLQGQVYEADTGLAIADMETGRQLQGQRYEQDTKRALVYDAAKAAIQQAKGQDKIDAQKEKRQNKVARQTKRDDFRTANVAGLVGGRLEARQSRMADDRAAKNQRRQTKLEGKERRMTVAAEAAAGARRDRIKEYSSRGSAAVAASQARLSKYLERY